MDATAANAPGAPDAFEDRDVRGAPGGQQGPTGSERRAGRRRLGLAAERHARLEALLEEPPSAIITRCTPITYFTTKDSACSSRTPGAPGTVSSRRTIEKQRRTVPGEDLAPTCKLFSSRQDQGHETGEPRDADLSGVRSLDHPFGFGTRISGNGSPFERARRRWLQLSISCSP